MVTSIQSAPNVGLRTVPYVVAVFCTTYDQLAYMKAGSAMMRQNRRGENGIQTREYAGRDGLKWWRWSIIRLQGSVGRI